MIRSWDVEDMLAMRSADPEQAAPAPASRLVWDSLGRALRALAGRRPSCLKPGRQALAELDERMLTDIGLTRDGVDRRVSPRVWPD